MDHLERTFGRYAKEISRDASPHSSRFKGAPILYSPNRIGLELLGISMALGLFILGGCYLLDNILPSESPRIRTQPQKYSFSRDLSQTLEKEYITMTGEPGGGNLITLFRQDNSSDPSTNRSSH